jgi:hypothetical protein
MYIHVCIYVCIALYQYIDIKELKKSITLFLDIW